MLAACLALSSTGLALAASGTTYYKPSPTTSKSVVYLAVKGKKVTEVTATLGYSCYPHGSCRTGHKTSFKIKHGKFSGTVKGYAKIKITGTFSATGVSGTLKGHISFDHGCTTRSTYSAIKET